MQKRSYMHTILHAYLVIFKFIKSYFPLFQDPILKKVIYIFLLLCTSFKLVAQDSSAVLDSLKTELSQAKEDTSKINIYIELFDYSAEVPEEEFEKMAKKAIKLAEKIRSEHPHRIYEIYHFLAFAYYHINKNERAIEYHEKVIHASDLENVHKYRPNSFLALGDIIRRKGDTDKALEYYLAAENLFIKDKNITHISKAKAKQAIVYRNRGEVEKSKLLLLESITVLNNKKDKEQTIQLANCYNSLGRTYRHLGNQDSAKICFELNIQISLEQGLEKNAAIGYTNLGNVHSDLGEKENALEAHLKALKIKEKLGNKQSLSISYHNIGGIRKDLGNLDEALKDLNKSLALSLETGFKRVSIFNYLKIGRIYREQGKYQEALKNHKKALEFSEETKNAKGINEAYGELGRDLFKLERYDLSVEYFYKAIQSSKKSKDETTVALATIGLANSYLKLQEQNPNSEVVKNMNQEEIEDMLLKAHKNLLSDDLTKQKITSFEALSNFYNYTKNHKQEAHYTRQLLVLKDSIANTEKIQAIADWETQYKTGEQEKEIIFLEKENKLVEREKNLLASRNKYFSAIAILLSLLLLGSAFFFLQLRKSKREIEAQNKQLEQLNSTKDKFFGIIAHDIRSPIVALDGVGEQMDYYLENNKTEKLKRLGSRIDSTAKKLSSLLDNLLNWALLQQGVIPYHPKSIQLQKITNHALDIFKENAAIKNIKLESTVSAEHQIFADEAAMHTMLRNLLSNAIKFTSTEGTVSIHSEQKDEHIIIKINDTGTGMSPEQVVKLFSLEKQSKKGTAGEKGTGLGLNLVKELAELNKGKISVESVLNQGSEFIIQIPMANK